MGYRTLREDDGTTYRRVDGPTPGIVVTIPHVGTRLNTYDTPEELERVWAELVAELGDPDDE
jgi:hypothetical protein